MQPLRYVPVPDAAGVPHVVVDGSPGTGTVLTISHWPGIPTPAGLDAPDADTSAEMVLRYLDLGADRHGDAAVATNNHFDQDGTAGLFALVDPDGALERRELVADLARAGDFGTYRSRTAARASMAIATMAHDAPQGSYDDACAALYTDALGILPELLDHPERFTPLWRDEDAVLDASEAAVEAGRVSVREDAELDLAVVTLDPDLRLGGGHRFGHVHEAGLHPMALHALTACTRLLVVQGDRYRYLDRYETWVRYRSRPVPKRVELAPLAEELTALEREGATWEATPASGLTPSLATAGGAPSSIPLADVETALVRHLRTAPVALDPFAPAD